MLPAQAEAITGVLDDLPDDFPPDLVEQGQELMVGFAATHNSTELRRLTSRLVEALAPDTVEEREAARLEREHRVAMRHRYLKFSYHHQGSVLISGSFPVGEAEPLIRIIDSYGAARKRGLDRLDPNTEYITPPRTVPMRCWPWSPTTAKNRWHPTTAQTGPGSWSPCPTTNL